MVVTIVNYCVDDGGFAPERAYADDAGFDLRTPIDFTVDANDSALVDTLVHIEIPKNCVGFLKSKSGLMVKDDITSDGTIDCGYTDSIRVKLFNHGKKPKKFERGDKISQIVIQPITPGVYMAETTVDKFENSERGNNGFGSSGR